MIAVAVFYKSHAEKCMKFCVTVLLVGGQNKKGVFCAEGLEKGTCQNKMWRICAEESRGGAMTIVFCKKFGKDL